MAGKCIFNNAWLENPQYKSWLQRVIRDDRSARCTFCSKNISISSMGESALKSHVKSKKHADIIAVRNSSLGGIKRVFSNAACSQSTSSAGETSVTHKDSNMDSHIVKNDVLDAEILWTFRTVKNHLPYKSNENIEKILHRMFPDSAITSKFTCGEKKTAYYAVFGIAPYLSNILAESLKNKEFVLLFDESLNIMRQEKQMDIYVRYWDNNKVVTSYFNSVFMGHSTAMDILEGFLSAISSLKFSKALQISMDGPNVNWKFYSMLQDSYFKEFNKKLINIGSCGLHIVHNAFKAGCIASTWGIEDFLTSLYYLFKNSPARKEDFMKISDSALPKKFVQHRWLENVPASECAIDLLPKIYEYVKSVNKGENNEPKCKSYVSITNHLKDNLLSVKLKIFHSIAKVLLPFLQKYQSDKPMLIFVSKDLKNILNLLFQRFILSDVLDSNQSLQKMLRLELRNAKIHKKLENIDLGFSAQKELQALYASKKVTDREIFDLKMESKKFLIAVSLKLIDKCPLQYKLTRNLSCLDPRKMATDKKNCLEKMKSVLNTLTEVNQIDENDCDEILAQFDCFLDSIIGRRSEFLEFSTEKSRVDELLNQTMNASAYIKLWKVVKLLLILSHGQATVERGFSINKKIEIENLKEMTYIAQRQICDYVNSVGGNVHDIQITHTLRTYVSNARQKYMKYLDDQKQIMSIATKKRKNDEEIQEMKNKKRCLEIDIAALLKSADEFAEMAEEQNDLASLSKSNNLRRAAKEKEKKLQELAQYLETVGKH